MLKATFEELDNWGPKTVESNSTNKLDSKNLEALIDVDLSLPANQRAQVYKILWINKLAFSFNRRLGKHPTKVHTELEEGTKPISATLYIASLAKQELLDKQLDLWLEQGVIEPLNSPWGALVLIVHQHSKDHLCIDWRKLNAATVADQFPIPHQSDILQALSGTQYLSSFDALAGFTQLEFNKVSQPYTAMWTHQGLHQFTCMPFQWRNRLPIFQHVMQEILSPYLWIFMLVYIDDIVVYSNSFKDHLSHVDSVLRAIRKSGITLAPHKCHVGYRSIQLLGQKVSWLGLSTNTEKILAISALATLQWHKDLKTFLGMAVYFMAYIPYFSKLASLLFMLLQKGTGDGRQNRKKPTRLWS
jgi:Reverse transcriptase (RNA-dependent DNA polymerase)